jgi:chorismate mutase
MRTFAIRGATSIEEDSVHALDAAVQELAEALLANNSLVEDEIISIIFTATPDIHSSFPATSLRKIGFQNTPLICAVEMDVPGAPALIIRAMVTVQKSAEFTPQHIYLGRATALRPDLAK